MACHKTFLCPANSTKTSGRCIAGKELLANGRFGAWIRPVSDRPTHEVSWKERHYQDGSDVALLDILRVPLLEWRPKPYQQENHRLDPSQYWTRVRRATWPDAIAVLDQVHGPLWNNSCSDSYNGTNDRVDERTAPALRSSLLMFQPVNLRINVALEGAEYARRKVRALFSREGSNYRISVTDPNMVRLFLAENNGTYQIDNAIMCISLGEVFGGFAYKLAAVIITPS